MAAHQDINLQRLVILDVKYILETTFKYFGVHWHRYENNFADLIRRHKGRDEKHSLVTITVELNYRAFPFHLRRLMESFVAETMLRKITTTNDHDRFILLIIQAFSYLRKTTDWFRDTFADFDTTAWPFDDGCSYTEACRRILHQTLYNNLRNSIRDSYVKMCRNLRSEYSYSNLCVFDNFHEKRAVPLFEHIKEWEGNNDVSIWWKEMFDTLHTNISKRLRRHSSERAFVILSRDCFHVELLFVDLFPDDGSKSKYESYKKRLGDIICAAYFDRSTGFSFLGLLKKGNFDGFLFNEFLTLHTSSWRREDLLTMHLRSKVRICLETKAVTLVDEPHIRTTTIEDLKPLLKDLEETKTMIMERLKPFFREYPALLHLERELSDSLRDSLGMYRIGYGLVQTQGLILDSLRAPRTLDAAFFTEAYYIALFIKNLAIRKDMMTELEIFAEFKFDENCSDDVKTLAAFVSRHRSVCSTDLYHLIKDAGLIEA